MSINQLPDELIAIIYEKLMPDDKVAIATTCVRFYSLQPGFIRWFSCHALIIRDIMKIEYSIAANISTRRIPTDISATYTLQSNRKYHDILTSDNNHVALQPEEKIGDPPAGDTPYLAAYVDIEYCAVTNLQLTCSISHGLV
jgi:hypothetical protein